jgi:hypothetical protein
MPSDTTWIAELRAGNRDAAKPLFDRYMARLVGLARKHLQGVPRRATSEEDVALAAFNSFYLRVERGEFGWVEDGTDLWRLLLYLTAMKAAGVANYERMKRRDHRITIDGLDGAAVSVLAREPTAEFAAQCAEEARRLLDSLDDPILRRIAVMRMEGFGIGEIAEELALARSTVSRKLKVIQETWTS